MRQLSASVSRGGVPPAAVARVLARPEPVPQRPGRRRQQRLRRRVEVQVGPEVDHQQAVVPVIAEVAEHERPGPEHGAVDAARPLEAEGRVLASQAQQVTMQGVCLGVSGPLGVVELAAGEGLRVVGAGYPPFRLGHRQAGELRELVLAAPVHLLGDLALLVAEVEERARCGELLTLEQQGRARPEQQDRRQGPVEAGVGQAVEALAPERVGQLVVVLQILDEPPRLQAGRRAAPPLPLPGIDLPLVDVAPLGRRDELLRRAEVVAIVRLAAARGGDDRGVVEVVGPQRIEPEAPLLRRPDQVRLLRLVLADDQRPAPPRGLAHPAGDRRQDVLAGRLVVRVLRRVDPQPIDMELLDPVGHVAQDELADRPRVLAVEVELLAPVVLVAVGEVEGRELPQEVAVGAEVAEADVEDDGQPHRVRTVDEVPHVVGGAVVAGRGEQVDAVVAPVEPAGELDHRHDLQHRRAQVGQRRQLLGGGAPGPPGRERADVHLVDHLPLPPRPPPAAVGPAEGGRVDHLGGPVRPVGLEPRRRVGIGRVPAVEAEPVARPGPRRGHPGREIALPVALQPDRGRPVARLGTGPPSRTTSTFLRPGAQTRNATPPPGTTSAPTGRRRACVASFIGPCQKVIGGCRRIPRSEGTACAARESQRPRGIPDRAPRNPDDIHRGTTIGGGRGSGPRMEDLGNSGANRARWSGRLPRGLAGNPCNGRASRDIPNLARGRLPSP